MLIIIKEISSCIYYMKKETFAVNTWSVTYINQCKFYVNNQPPYPFIIIKCTDPDFFFQKGWVSVNLINLNFPGEGPPLLMHHHLLIIMILSLQARTVPFHRSTTLPLAMRQNRRESPDDPWTNFRSVGTHSRGTEVVLGEWGQPQQPTISWLFC